MLGAQLACSILTDRASGAHLPASLTGAGVGGAQERATSVSLGMGLQGKCFSAAQQFSPDVSTFSCHQLVLSVLHLASLTGVR